MLSLDSPKWSELSHAYGKASDIPSLLRQLRTASPPEKYDIPPWGNLWSSLCHQGDVYTASYAAVPHIVNITSRRPIEERVHHISLISSIEIGRCTDTAPLIPNILEKAYFSALESVLELVLECLELDWEEYEYKTLFGALAAIRGKAAFGNAIFMMDNTVVCSECDATFVTPGYDIFQHHTIESEGIKEFRESDAGYETWLRQNQRGFVLFAPVTPPLSYVIQHRVGCPQLNEIKNNQEYIKVCAPNFHKVIFWLYRYGLTPHRSVNKCDICKV